MKKYSSYRATGEVWLRQIPFHWENTKIKHLFDERVEKGYPNEPLLVASQNMGVVPKKIYGNRTVEATKDLQNLKLVKKGDFVISLRSFQGGIEKAYYRGIISPAYTIMVPKKEIREDYFKYLAKSKLFIELLKLCVTGIREGQNIDYTKLKNHRIPVPPREEQDKIVRFLDWKVSEINKLINIREKEIENLEFLKKTIVDDVVVHGLKSNAKMKFSGVDWLGDIPSHWKLIKLRGILKPFSEKNHADLPLLSVVREQGVIIRNVESKEENHNYIPDDLSNYKVVKKGQFAMNKMKAWQGSYGISPYTGIVSPAYFVFNVNFNNLEYFHLAIRSNVYVNFFAQASDGIRVGQWDLQMDKMKEIPFIVPTEEEQQEIVDCVKTRTLKISDGVGKISEEIGLLSELKTRLISDVVTGQIDVRDVDIPDYELEDEKSGESHEQEG